MRLGLRLLSLVVACALGAGVTLALAGDEDGLASDLERYFPIGAALAEDTLDGIGEQALGLAGSGDKAVAKAAKPLVEAKDLRAARKGFGDLSKALLARVQGATKRGRTVPPLYIFECSMSKPYGRWLQETEEIANPYMGRKMLACGKLVGTAGGAEVKKEEGGHGHGGKQGGGCGGCEKGGEGEKKKDGGCH